MMDLKKERNEKKNQRKRGLCDDNVTITYM